MGVKRIGSEQTPFIEEDLQRKFESKVIEDLKQYIGKVQRAPEKIKSVKDKETDKRRGEIEVYTEIEPDFAKNQRELFNLKPEQFLIFKELIPGRQTSLTELISNYSKNESVKMRLQREQLNMTTLKWVELHKTVPLMKNREVMVKSYLEKEPPEVLEKRQSLGLKADELLVNMGILSEQPVETEAIQEPDIKRSPKYKIPSRATSDSPYVVA